MKKIFVSLSLNVSYIVFLPSIRLIYNVTHVVGPSESESESERESESRMDLLIDVTGFGMTLVVVVGGGILAA